MCVRQVSFTGDLVQRAKGLAVRSLSRAPGKVWLQTVPHLKGLPEPIGGVKGHTTC